MAEQKEKLTIEVGAKDESGPAFESVERRLKMLKDQFGKKGESISLPKELLELGVGGGAVAGLGVLANVGGEVLSTWGETIQKIKESKSETIELAAELSKSLPIIGGLSTGLEKFLGAATGSTAAIEAMRKKAEETDQHTETLKNRAEAKRGAIDAIREFDNSEALRRMTNAGEPLSDLAQLDQETRVRLKQLSQPLLSKVAEQLGIPGADEETIRKTLAAMRASIPVDTKALNKPLPAYMPAFSSLPFLERQKYTVQQQADYEARYEATGGEAAYNQAVTDRNKIQSRLQTNESILKDVLPEMAALDARHRNLIREQQKDFNDILGDWAVDRVQSAIGAVRDFIERNSDPFILPTPFLPGQTNPPLQTYNNDIMFKGIPFLNPEDVAIENAGRETAIAALRAGIARRNATDNVSGYVPGLDARGMTGVRPVITRDPQVDAMQELLRKLEARQELERKDRQEQLNVARDMLGEFRNLVNAITQ